MIYKFLLVQEIPCLVYFIIAIIMVMQKINQGF